jgi:hypothetical protein
MKPTTTTTIRSNKKWSVPECLQLQREYELLGLSVDEISQLHKRSSRAIMFKLDKEGFADYNALYETQQAISPSNVTTDNHLVVDQDVLETKIDYLVAGVEPKLLAEMKQACDRCEKLLKKMRYFTEGSSQCQNKNRLSMY